MFCLFRDGSLNQFSAIPLQPRTSPLRLLTPMAVSKPGSRALLTHELLLQAVKRLEQRGTTSFASIPVRPTTCALSRKGPKYTLRRTSSFVKQTQAQTHLQRRPKNRYSLDTVCYFVLTSIFVWLTLCVESIRVIKHAPSHNETHE
jgi:hypothetical protein